MTNIAMTENGIAVEVVPDYQDRSVKIIFWEEADNYLSGKRAVKNRQWIHDQIDEFIDKL